MSTPTESASFDALNEETTSLKVTKEGGFLISISGTFVATISLQLKPDGHSAWITHATYTAAAAVLESWAPANCEIKLKCTAFTSGQADVVVGV